MGLDSAFDAVVISGEVGATKPDPAIFEVALDRLGMSERREHVWHVGDSLTSDVAGAVAAGLSSVWVNRSGQEREPGAPRPTLEVATLHGLCDLMTP